MSWQKAIEKWELEVISRHNMLDIPRDVWTARQLAKNLYFMDLSAFYKKTGREKEAECRDKSCEFICRHYWGRDCTRYGGQRVPTVIGLLKTPFGNTATMVDALFQAEATVEVNR